MFLIGLVGCSGDDGDESPATTGTGDTGSPPTTPEGLAIVGSYTDEFGTEHVVDEVSWSQTYPGYGTSVWDLTSYDNDARFLVAQNAADNAYGAGLWSRFDWVGDLAYCQTAYDAATEADAAATPRPDDADLAGGCGGSPWTDLTP
jgi:hypothetical protein